MRYFTCMINGRLQFNLIGLCGVIFLCNFIYCDNHCKKSYSDLKVSMSLFSNTTNLLCLLEAMHFECKSLICNNTEDNY